MHYINLNNKFIFYNEEEIMKERSPLKIEDNWCISKISNLKFFLSKGIHYKYFEIYDNLMFTPVFNEMIDLIHFGIYTGTPIILEGHPGQGKNTAINYINKLLNYNIENIVITYNLTVENLFKKTILEPRENYEFKLNGVDTKLNKILSENDFDFDEEFYMNEKYRRQNPTIFVFHNIEKASSEILSRDIKYI